MNAEKILKTYHDNLAYREGIKLMKSKMDKDEYIKQYRKADHRVQRSKFTMKKHGLNYD